MKKWEKRNAIKRVSRGKERNQRKVERTTMEGMQKKEEEEEEEEEKEEEDKMEGR